MKVLKKIMFSKIFNMYLLFFLSFILIEIIFRLISSMDILSWSMYRIIIGLNILSIFLGLITSFIKKTPRLIVSLLIILAVSIYSLLQLAFNTFIGVYMSINTSSQLGAVKDYIRDFLNSIELSYYLILIPFVLSLALVIVLLIRKKEDPVYFKLKSKIRTQNGIKVSASCIIIILLGFLYADSLTNERMQNPLQTVSTLSLFKYPSIPSVAVKNMGIIGFGINDFKTLFIENEEQGVVYYANLEEEEATNNTRVFDDTEWQYVIDNENNSTYNSINKYLINNRSTNTNDYTGLFEGKNVIVIMMESAGEILINEEYFPNFYKMYNDGFHFVNSYSPRNACATGNNEFSALTSLYSIYNNCTANVYKNNHYYQSMFSLFNNKGYNTVSMHDYTEAYYYRKTIHPNMGVMSYYGVEDLGISYQNEYVNWASDEDFATVAMDIVLNSGDYDDAPFMLWMTTVSAHQPYSVDSITGRQYFNLYKDLPYNIEIKRYMSKLKNLDNALGILMDRLDKKGMLDDTVFVLFGDHYPYGISNSKLYDVLQYDLSDYENERTPFTIYSSSTKGKEFTQYTSYINITPTVANLFNLDYDPRLYMGEDIFSEQYESKVVFADGSWKNEKVYYNAKTGSIINYVDNDYTTEDIIRINQEISSKMSMSSAIIKSDFFTYLDNALKEAKESLLVSSYKEE